MTLTIQRHLDFITAQRVQKFRPARFRTLLPIDSSVPRWATRVEHSQVTFSGEMPIPVGAGPVKNAPMTTLDRSSGYIGIVNFAQQYAFTTIEEEQADRAGIMLAPTLALGNQKKNERLFDDIAAGDYLASLGLPGLLNIAGKTADGVHDWATVTVEQILSDVGTLLAQVNENTLENYAASQIILPPGKHEQLTLRFHATTGRSALSYVTEAFPGLSIRTWHKCTTAGGTSHGRMVVMARGEDVARMIITRELSDEPVSYSSGAYSVMQYSGTAGVLVETPEAVVYGDWT